MTKEIAETIDKSKWGKGPWQKEPDRMEWEHKGLPCLIVRGPVGAWCGYVAVPPSHPWHGIGYSDCVKGCPPVEPKPLEPIGDKPVPGSIQDWHLKRKHFACGADYQPGHTPESIIKVHGGLTYADFCQGHVCHIPKPGKPDNVYWFGFDCAHFGDVCPKYEELGKQIGYRFEAMLGGRYWNVEHVRAEVERLADQLIAIHG